MLKKMFGMIKKIVFSTFLIYSYNIISAPLSLIVPINIITVLLVSFLGLPALLALIFVLMIVF